MSAACRLTWCQSTHDNDDPTVSRHWAVIGETSEIVDTLTVTIRWAERHDGRSIPPHLTVRCASNSEVDEVDLTAREAAAWSAILSASDAHELAGFLDAGTELLAPHDDQDHDGEPHRVAGDVPVRTGNARFTWSLIIEVFDALERHGYRKASDRAGGKAIGLLMDLADVYEGSRQ